MENRILYAILTLLLNQYGVPCFMQGKVKEGVIRIVLAVVTFGIIGLINTIFGIIQGIKLLCMSDEDYAAIEDKTTLIVGVPKVK